MGGGMKKRIKRKEGTRDTSNLASKYGDPKKITRGDIIAAAKENARKDLKNTKGGGKDAAGKNPADRNKAMTSKTKNALGLRKDKTSRDKKMGGGMMKKRMKRGGKVGK